VNYTFASTLKKSFVKANSQILIMTKAMFALFLLMIRDFLICIALLLAGFYIKGKAGFILELLAVIYFVWVALKANAAIGLALVLISSGEKDHAAIAKKSLKNAFVFFWNGLQTGVILFFGQMLLVCPCFIFRNNFVFSPNLYVYENLRGKAAKERSKELASGFGWIILNRTAAIILMGYFFLILAAFVFASRSFYEGSLIVILMLFYFALLQSNFIHEIYTQTLEMHQQGIVNSSGKYKLITAFSVILLLLVYVGMHWRI
jgi:hypothetical protein